MTQRFGDIDPAKEYSIVNDEEPEPPRPSAPARAVASVRKSVQESARKSPTMTAFIAGLLTGSTISLLSRLIG